MDILISILSLLGFVLLTASTGLFVAIEFALTGLEKSTVETHVKQKGDSSARAVQRDHQNLSFVLSGAQLGITALVGRGQLVVSRSRHLPQASSQSRFWPNSSPQHLSWWD